MDHSDRNEEEFEPKIPFYKTWDFWKPTLGIVLGGIAGFMYYYNVGCSTGGCAISGNPYMSTLYGGMLGLFLVKSPCSSGRC